MWVVGFLPSTEALIFVCPFLALHNPWFPGSPFQQLLTKFRPRNHLFLQLIMLDLAINVRFKDLQGPIPQNPQATQSKLTAPNPWSENWCNLQPLASWKSVTVLVKRVIAWPAAGSSPNIMSKMFMTKTPQDNNVFFPNRHNRWKPA